MKIEGSILCEHLQWDKDNNIILNAAAIHKVIETGNKRMILCKVCDNVLRGHYIGELENIIIKVASK